MKINGENFSQSKPVLLRDLIKNLGYSTDKIAVELNGDIVPKSSYSEITARSGDIIEIVSFVGGG
jgi:sulfur carrier protein